MIGRVTALALLVIGLAASPGRPAAADQSSASLCLPEPTERPSHSPPAGRGWTAARPTT